MKRALVVVALALATAAPAAASVSTSGTVRGAGTVRMNGMTGPTAFFSIDLANGKGGKIAFGNPRTHTSFHSRVLSTLRFSTSAVKITGLGYANGRLVPFTMIATDHPAPAGDWFRISWAHGPSLGGPLTSGNIDVAALIAGINGGGNTAHPA